VAHTDSEGGGDGRGRGVIFLDNSLIAAAVVSYINNIVLFYMLYSKVETAPGNKEDSLLNYGRYGKKKVDSNGASGCNRT
jgi:hypothetical protein